MFTKTAIHHSYYIFDFYNCYFCFQKFYSAYVCTTAPQILATNTTYRFKNLQQACNHFYKNDNLSMIKKSTFETMIVFTKTIDYMKKLQFFLVKRYLSYIS